MHPTGSALADGLRLTALRRPRSNPAGYGAGTFVILLLAYLAAETFRAWVQAGPPRSFVGYGVVGVLADSLLTLVAAWLLSRVAKRPGIVWGVATLALAATIFTSVFIHWPLQVLAGWFFTQGSIGLALGLVWLSRAWWLFVLVALARWLGPRRWSINLAAAVLAFLVCAAPWWGLPNAPIIAHDRIGAQAMAQANADAITSGGFDQDDDAYEDFDAEAVMYEQGRLVDEALAALTPRTPGAPNLYVLAFAGDGSESVFRNEAEYVERLFASRFNAEGHVVVLENHPATVAMRPLATFTNLRRVLAGIASRMDPGEDILFVYLTSHGSEDHLLYVGLDPLPLNQIAPEDLAYALQTTPSIRWKVLVVNACYSGGFIDALRDDSTLVIAAARADRTSFGCGSESEITYFGKAFLAEALNQTTSIPDAFAIARDTVAQWEQRDEVEQHSEPQISSSRSIEARLERWQQTLSPHPAVPFAPATDRDSENSP